MEFTEYQELMQTIATDPEKITEASLAVLTGLKEDFSVIEEHKKQVKKLTDENKKLKEFAFENFKKQTTEEPHTESKGDLTPSEEFNNFVKGFINGKD